MRKIFAFLICLACPPAFSQSAPKACVIVHAHQYKFGENISRFHRHKAFDYIEGEFPSGMKFNSELDSNRVQEIHDKGGKVVVLPSDYKLPDLQDARETCKVFIAQSR